MDTYNKIYNEIISNPEKYYGKGKIKMGVEEFTRMNMDEIDTLPYGEEYFAPVAIKEGNMDLLLWIFKNETYVENLMDKLYYNRDTTLIEDFLALLDEEDLKKLVTTTSVDRLAILPRQRGCNEDLINLYFKYIKYNKIGPSGLYRLVYNLTEGKGCTDLIYLILDNIEKLVKKGYQDKDLDHILKEYLKYKKEKL